VVRQEQQLPFASAQEHGVGVTVLVSVRDLNELHTGHVVQAKGPKHTHVSTFKHLMDGRAGDQWRAVAAHHLVPELPQTFDVSEVQVGHGHDVWHHRLVATERVGPRPQLVSKGFRDLDQQVPPVFQFDAKGDGCAPSAGVRLGQATEATTAPCLGQSSILRSAEHDHRTDDHASASTRGLIALAHSL
jgi:hypothetical protein